MASNLPPDRLVLETGRLVVRLAGDDDVPAIVRYYAENRGFLKPYEPARPELFFQERFWRAQVRQNLADLQDDEALRLFLFPRDGGGRVIGSANFTNIARGVSHSCNLGYSLSEGEQGRGYMAEALRAAIDHVFGPLNLHRVQATYMPHNRRSGRLLRRLGFVVEGYARDYLRIDDAWEDHVLTSLTNPGWSPWPGA
jgi:[ribosomal protein S5]-alanine N-acetyltransferase